MADDINKTTSGDVAHSITKGGLGSIPVLGSLAAEIFGLIITPPLEKRRAELMNEIAGRLKKLEENNTIDLASLSQNEQFIDTVLQAISYALKTSEKEKILAFQNAIINTATGECPDKTAAQIFLNQLDSYTVWHIKLLKFIDNPKQWFLDADIPLQNYTMTNTFGLILKAFPELRNQDDLLNKIWEDLMRSGFHNSPDMRAVLSKDEAFGRRTTQFGRDFLKFIMTSIH